MLRPNPVSRSQRWVGQGQGIVTKHGWARVQRRRVGKGLGLGEGVSHLERSYHHRGVKDGADCHEGTRQEDS